MQVESVPQLSDAPHIIYLRSLCNLLPVPELREEGRPQRPYLGGVGLREG